MLSHFSRVQLFATSCVVAQVPLSVGFSRQEYWSGLPFPPPGDIPEQGSCYSCMAGGFFIAWTTREAHQTKTIKIKILSWSFPHKVSVHFIPNPRGKEQSLSARSPPHGPVSSPQAENKGLSSHGSPLSHHFCSLRISPSLIPQLCA